MEMLVRGWLGFMLSIFEEGVWGEVLLEGCEFGKGKDEISGVSSQLLADPRALCSAGQMGACWNPETWEF